MSHCKSLAARTFRALRVKREEQIYLLLWSKWDNYWCYFLFSIFKYRTVKWAFNSKTIFSILCEPRFRVNSDWTHFGRLKWTRVCFPEQSFCLNTTNWTLVWDQEPFSDKSFEAVSIRFQWTELRFALKFLSEYNPCWDRNNWTKMDTVASY